MWPMGPLVLFMLLKGNIIFIQDLYVLAALIFLALNATQNATMKSLATKFQMKEVRIYDRNSIACLAAIFTFFHIIFGIYIAVTVRNTINFLNRLMTHVYQLLNRIIYYQLSFDKSSSIILVL